MSKIAEILQLSAMNDIVFSKPEPCAMIAVTSACFVLTSAGSDSEYVVGPQKQLGSWAHHGRISMVSGQSPFTADGAVQSLGVSDGKLQPAIYDGQSTCQATAVCVEDGTLTVPSGGLVAVAGVIPLTKLVIAASMSDTCNVTLVCELLSDITVGGVWTVFPTKLQLNVNGQRGLKDSWFITDADHQATAARVWPLLPSDQPVVA